MNEILELKIESITNYGFYITTFNKMNDDFELILKIPHRSMCYQLYFITEGNGWVWIDSNKNYIQPRTLCSLSKDMVSYMEWEKLSGYAVLFTEEFLCRYAEDMIWLNNLKMFYQPDASPIHIREHENYVELLILLKKIQSEYETDFDFAKNEIIVNLLKALLMTAERHKRDNVLNENIELRDLTLLINFKNELEKDFIHSRMVRYYSDQLNVTPKKLNHIVSSYWGKTAKSAIEERVLLESKRLLIHTGKSVKEIGRDLGFSDPTNFNKFFKRNTEITPAEYRHSDKK